MTPKRSVLGIGCVVFGLLDASAPTADAPQSPHAASATRISDLAWIGGAWALDQPGLHIEEHWTARASNALLGMSCTLRGDRMVAFEYLRIVQRDDGIFYIAQPGGRPATDFKLIRFDGTTAIFENPEHDFPKRVLYQRNPDGSLTARVDAGPGPNAQAEVFAYKRM